jgi:hypothetical protein
MKEGWVKTDITFPSYKSLLEACHNCCLGETDELTVQFKYSFGSRSYIADNSKDLLPGQSPPRLRAYYVFKCNSHGEECKFAVSSIKLTFINVQKSMDACITLLNRQPRHLLLCM